MSAGHITFFIGQCLMSVCYFDPWFQYILRKEFCVRTICVHVQQKLNMDTPMEVVFNRKKELCLYFLVYERKKLIIFWSRDFLDRWENCVLKNENYIVFPGLRYFNLYPVMTLKYFFVYIICFQALHGHMARVVVWLSSFPA